MKAKEKITLQYEDAEFVIDLFFKMVAELLQISMQISNEFIDSDTIHRRESRFLITPESLKDYIFRNGLSEDEKSQRKEYLKTEMVDLLSRQTALLAGYRNSIEIGVKDLLKELDPEIAMKKIVNKKVNIGPLSIQQKYFPFSIYRKIFKKMLGIFNSLDSKRNDDIKNKYFRPAFINGYLKSIHSDQEGINIDSYTEKSI